MTKTELAGKVYDRLIEAYPEATISLNHRDPWQLLVATILSAQCTDKQVNKVTQELFEEYSNARQMSRAKLEKLKAIVRPTGFYNNKAEAIKGASKYIIENNGGKVPDDMETLLELPGVGRKTANVVLGDGFGIPGVVVDTHVKRISYRIGLTNQKRPENIESDLNEIFPKDQWIALGHLMIAHGRKICKARNPRCEQCFMEDICAQVEVPTAERS